MTNDERYDIMATIKDPDVPFAKKGNYIGKILRDYPSFKKHEILTALDMMYQHCFEVTLRDDYMNNDTAAGLS